MEAASNAEPNRSYSWRSDFHISPKNCKWLQDNLNDMEMKIKAMIKLVEEDADSFARRAEMYYKKRPELMKLVEEFYRAYRALAERYDRVAGTLREANRTIAAVFPNHSELLFPEEASTGLADVGDEEAGERTPFSDKEELKRMSWLFSDEVLKKIGENMFKNLNLKEDRGKDCQCEKLQEELSNLSEENKNHKSHILFESARAGKAETELNNLKEAISKLRVELEATFHQYQASEERIMNLEAEISQIQDEFQHLNDEMSIKASKLNISEDRCRSLEQENSCLKLEVDKLNQVLIRQREEAFDFVNENQNLCHQLNSESKRADQVESDSISLKDAITKLKSEMATALLQYHVSQGRISDLEYEIRHINDEMSVKVCKLNMSEDQCLSLREENKSLQRKLDEHKQRLMRQDEEISMRDEELHRVKQTLEDMHQQNIHAEIKENSLQLEVNMLKQRLVGQEEELSKREKELAKLKRCIEDEWHKHMNSEWAQQSLVNLHYQSDEKLRVLSLEIQNKNDKLKRMELRTTDLEEELRQLYNENNDLIDKSISTVSKIVSLQDEIISLRGLKQNLEKELQIHAEESRFLQQELSSIENERNGFEKGHRELTDKLGEMQFSKAGLEEELRHLRNENYVLKEESYASLSKILSLQDEIISLRESNRKLEDALQFHVEKKEALQQELSCLKNEKNDAEKRHHDLTQQIERVNCNVDSLQALIMEFHDGCEGPKCKKFEKLEDEKPFYFDKFRLMEDLPEKNAIYNISLSNMNTELICLQEKIKGLEEYFQSLHGNILKTVRVSHAENVNQKIEKVSATNSFLENSLSDLNVEFNILRGKVKNLEESCLSFCDQKSHLIAENSDLIPQAKRVGLHLQSLENRFLLFEENIKNTEEKELHQVSTLNNQIYLLKETIQAMMEELEEEQYKTVKSEIDSFIMLQVLVDMKDKNLSLSEECHKYKEKLRRTKELIFGLKHEWTFQEKRLALLSEDIAKHFQGINVKIKADDADRDCKTSNKGDDGVLHIILDKITVLQNYLPGAKEEIHQLLFERSLFSTFLEQLGLNLTELSAQREVMKEESFKLESSMLQSTNQDFFETSKKSSSQQLLDLNGTRKRLQAQIQRLLEQNKSLTEKVYKLRAQNEMLDEENEIILEKAITDEFLSLILWSFNDEKSSEIEWLIGGVEHLYLVTNELGQEMRSINRKMRALESENMHLKEECRNHIVLLEDKIQKARNALGNLNVKTQTGTKLSEWREMEIQDTQNLQIFKVPEDDILESNKVKLVREKLENLLLTEENALKSTEISRLH
ncbi:hypothetical protein AXF42_Ash009619 [Apostasia shenzhenica]|uniref:NAB domain-containing protein n=1 Tax=Apostasia shenzhenica TaxID=1088818 RepID=A0A2I0B9C8_9ASPA|nr:hypothetical protein AXF42_Ash009619 [Apostasia shenzhenica]